MDKLEKLRAEMRERLDYDVEQRTAPSSPGTPLDPYELAKAQNPGQEVFALAIAVKCPNPQCEQSYPVGMFVTFDDGQQFHFPCRKCDAFLTVRDTFQVFSKNTYPVERVQKAMQEQDGKYQTWINTLKAAYAELRAVAPKVMDEARVREQVMHEGKGSQRPIKMRMTVQSPQEAMEEMRPTINTTGRHDKFSETSTWRRSRSTPGNGRGSNT
jgi:arsenate reductase-like glutaredoxin family protein